MPYPNFHAFRVKEPSEFVEKSFRNKTLPNSKGIEIIIGKLKTDPTGSTVTQAYRFPKNNYTAKEAKEWLKNNKIKGIKFEPAKESDDSAEDIFDIGAVYTNIKSDNKIYHFDIMDDTVNNLATKFIENENGFLTGIAIPTNIGVFTYRDNTGNLIRELRPPEEVFDMDSMNSLCMKPVTNEHPEDLVTTENYKDFAVGMTGSNCSHDAYALSIPLTITDSKTIQEIKEGKRSLSCGYSADLEDTAGNWCGIPYDKIQRNIKYNHIAVVDMGRAGDLAKIKMDSINNIHFLDKINNKESNAMELKKIILDGVEYSAEAEIIKQFNLLSANRDELKKELTNKSDKIEALNVDFSKLQAEKDTLQDKLNLAEKEIANLKVQTMDEEKIKIAIADRLALVESAKKANIEINDSMKNIDIKKSIICKIFPNAKLDDKDEIYITARYDSAIELLSIQTENLKNSPVMQTIQNPITETKKVDVYEDYKQSLKNAYKKRGDK